jgi:hypothetical protein
MGSCVAMQPLSTITQCRLDVEHISSLSSPFLLGHRLVRDDVLAEHVLELPFVTPMLWVAVLEPEDARRDIGRHMLDVRRVHRFCSTSRHENLDGVIAVAVGALVERTLGARLSKKQIF